jgi:hypothetical protein
MNARELEELASMLFSLDDLVVDQACAMHDALKAAAEQVRSLARHERGRELLEEIRSDWFHDGVVTSDGVADFRSQG